MWKRAAVSFLLILAAQGRVDSAPWAYTAVAEAQAVNPDWLYATALKASGAKLPNGCTQPWPWVVTLDRQRRQFFPSRLEAEAAIRNARLAGVKTLRIGLLQVAWREPAKITADPAELLEPYLNLRTGAAALRQHSGKAWPKGLKKVLARAEACGGSARPARQPLRVAYRPTRTPAPSADIAALVEAIAPQYGIDPELVLAVIGAESSGNPYARSNKNAQGLMQLIPATARRFGVSDPWNPEDNIRGGTAYLNWLLRHFNGDVALTLAGYNAGENAVDQHGGIPPYAETQGYVRKIIGRYGRSSHPVPPPLPGGEG